MITSDGRSEIETEVEQLGSGGPDLEKTGCRNPLKEDCLDAPELNAPSAPRLSAFASWVERLFGKFRA